MRVLSQDKEIDSKEIQIKLYGKVNNKSYHELRRRLLDHITEFVMVKRMDEDSTSESKVAGFLAIGRYMLEHRKSRVGWKYLKKAEQLALENDLYAQLLSIYQTQIEFASSNSAPDLEDILEKQEKNAELYRQHLNLEVATSKIRIRLGELKAEGSSVGIKKVVDEVLQAYDLSNEVAKDPKMLYQLMSIARSVAVADKNFVEFEEVLIPQMQDMLAKYQVKRKDRVYVLNLYYMSAHALYRNKKFEESLVFVDRMEEMISQNKSFFQRFYPRFVLQKAAVLSYMGENKESIELLVSALEKYENRIVKVDQNNMRLNLAVYYFQNEDFALCNRTLLSIKSTDRTLSKRMGLEWLGRMRMIQILTYFELERVEMALRELKSFRRRFKEQLKEERREGTRVFLTLIQQCCQKPDWISTEEYFNRVSQVLEQFPLDQSDIQAIGFYCWLKSKKERRGYYGVLLEVVAG